MLHIPAIDGIMHQYSSTFPGNKPLNKNLKRRFRVLPSLAGYNSERGKATSMLGW
jgi:hypothetical protein